MTSGHETVYPISKDHDHLPSKDGLTKRELFAAKFTAAYVIGIVTASGNNAHNWSYEDFAKEAVSMADALIAELNK